ncbi:MAG TPA: response regulator, partial [Rubellimicrobium sp.]|nr:response regulator [Rubellimicrobium sp.]
DTLGAAERHLRAYRPGAVIVDLHLPDGSGLDLIRSLARARPRIPAILATSGDPDQAWAAAAAGADGFLAKPIPGLAAFQTAVLAHLPLHRQPPARRPLAPGAIPPDPQALRDDLTHAATLLAGARPRLDYITGFLTGVARNAGDRPLAEAAQAAAASGTPGPLAQVLRQRLDAAPAP